MKKPMLITALAFLAFYSAGCSPFWHKKLSQAAVREGGEAHRLAKYKSALIHFNNAIALDPDNSLAYSSRGAVYVAQGRYSLAIADLDKAISIAPDHADSYFHRGEAYRKTGDMERAAADYTTAIALNPDNAKAYIRRATAYAKLGKNKEAAADLKKFLQYAPTDIEAQKLLSSLTSPKK